MYTSTVDRYALALEASNQMRLVTPPPTEPAEGAVLIETQYVAICGTDLEVIDGTSDRARPPIVLGHEWAGRAGGAFVVGENVVGPGREIGFELPGGFASHFVAPARNLHPLPDFLHGPAACLIEPLAVAVRACRAAKLEPSDTVLVLGDGVIGMFVARVASLTASRVLLVGRHDDRLRLASALGVPRVSTLPDVTLSWSAIFEASGRESGLHTALSVAAPLAQVVLVGDYGSALIPVDVTVVVRKELRWLGSNASQGAWNEAVRLASTRAVDLNLVPLLVLPFERWPEALEAARKRTAPRVVLRHTAADSR